MPSGGKRTLMGNMTVPPIVFAEAIDRAFAGKTHAPTRSHIKIGPKNLVTIGKQTLNEPERETLTGGALRLVRLAKTLPKGFV